MLAPLVKDFTRMRGRFLTWTVIIFSGQSRSSRQGLIPSGDNHTSQFRGRILGECPHNWRTKISRHEGYPVSAAGPAMCPSYGDIHCTCRDMPATMRRTRQAPDVELADITRVLRSLYINSISPRQQAPWQPRSPRHAK